MTPSRPLRTRRLAWLGAIAAAAVATVFATIGDGVPTRGDGVVKAITAHGHTLTWVLLAAALAVFAVDKGPRKLSAVLGYCALACYAAFVVATLTTEQSG